MKAQYRRSYLKTSVIAGIGATVCLLVGVVLVFAGAMDLPGIQAVLIIPSLVRVVAGIMFIGFALCGYTITVGGVLALHYDAKGRAVF